MIGEREELGKKTTPESMMWASAREIRYPGVGKYGPLKVESQLYSR